MKKVVQNNSLEFINRFINAYKMILSNSMSTITFDFDNKDNIENMVIVKNENNIFYLFNQNSLETTYILNKKYLKFIKDKRYKNSKSDIIYKDVNNKITDSLKDKDKLIYKLIYGPIWKKEDKIYKKNILKFNSIYIEVNDVSFGELYNETINIEKQKNLNQLNNIINFNNEDVVMNIIHTLKEILGEDIFRY